MLKYRPLILCTAVECQLSGHYGTRGCPESENSG